jgi:hypothetical protein
MVVVEYVVLFVVEFNVSFVYVDLEVVVWVKMAFTVKVLEAESPASIPDAVIV